MAYVQIMKWNSRGKDSVDRKLY